MSDGDKKIDGSVLEQVESDYLKWKEYMNIGAGVLGFNLALSCLGTLAPQKWAAVSAVFMAIFLCYGKKHFPKKIKELRKAQLVGIEELVLLGIEKKYFGWAALIKNFPLYLAAMFFLILIAMGTLK